MLQPGFLERQNEDRLRRLRDTAGQDAKLNSYMTLYLFPLYPHSLSVLANRDADGDTHRENISHIIPLDQHLLEEERHESCTCRSITPAEVSMVLVTSP